MSQKKRRDDQSLLDAVKKQGDPLSPDAQLAIVRQLEAKLAGTKAALKVEAAKRAQAESELVRVQERLDALIESRDGLEANKLARIAKRRKGKAAAILCLCDWHAEGRVDSRMVDDANRFDLAVAKKRIKRVWHKTLYLLDFVRHISQIDELIVWLGGDLINGIIHQELRETNFLGQAEAVMFVQNEIATGIEFLKKEAPIDHITVVTNYGNHGRDGREKFINNAHNHSWEWVAYQNLAWYYKKDPKVAFKVEIGYHNWYETHGHTIRFHHGDAIRYRGGVGGVTIPLHKKIAAWNQRRKPHLDVLGHFHQFLDHWRYVVCGSLIGYDAYANYIAAEFQEPTQTFIVIDQQYGKVLAMPVFCKDAKE